MVTADSTPRFPLTARRHGLTLIELLVVMVILVILTTVAVQATSSIVDQGRYEATQRTLQSIQDAILGPAGQHAPDGSLLITGFVADMGRLPMPIYSGGTLQGDPLRELWDASVIPSAEAYASQPPVPILNQNTTSSASGSQLEYPPPLMQGTGYTDYNNTSSPVPVAVNMPCGWRGPYLQLGAGSSGQLLDGWGNTFDSIYQTTSSPYSLTTPPPAGFPVNIVRSRGADNAVDSSPLPANFPAYDIDQYVPAQLSSPPPAPPLISFSNTVTATLTVSVRTITTTSSGSVVGYPTSVATSDAVQIALFAPGNGGSPTGGGLLTAYYAQNTSITTATAYYFPVATTTSWDSISLPSTTPGPRAVQAFQFDTSGNVIKRSPLTFLMVPAGGLTASTTLILQ